MDRFMSFINNVLFDAMLIFMVAAAAFALLMGILMLAAPALVTRLGDALNRNYSTRKAFKPMEIPRYQERFFYHHHRIFGAAIVLGAAFFFYQLLTDYSHAAGVAMLSRWLQPVISNWLVDSLTLILAAGNALALILGILIFIRPSLLKEVEESSNRWLSTRQAVRPLEEHNEAPDRFYRRHPRGVALFVVLGSLYVLVSFLFVLL